jgi:flagellar export protein FliJ
MKPFESQIKLNKWHVDEAQRHLSGLVRLAERFQDDLKTLEVEAADEQAAAETAPMEARQTYHGYLAQVAVRRETLKRSIADVEAEIDQARETLRDAFAELKKFETAAEAAVTRARRLRDQRAQQADDEVALNGFRRRSGN